MRHGHRSQGHRECRSRLFLSGANVSGQRFGPAAEIVAGGAGHEAICYVAVTPCGPRQVSKNTPLKANSLLPGGKGKRRARADLGFWPAIHTGMADGDIETKSVFDLPYETGEDTGFFL